MDVALGLLGLTLWIAGVVALAAAVTYLVVRVTPGERPAAPGASASER